ncbi:MAG: hypothetical protein WBI07_05810 [Mobilitalea sp.]
MKNKRRFIILLAAMVILLCTMALTGCQLAIPSTNGNVTSDKLCGVFVTIGYDNTALDNEAFNNMNVTVDDNGELSFDEAVDASLSGNRIEGKLSEDKTTVIFEGISGYYMGNLHEKDKNGEDNNALMCDPGLGDVKYAINVTDNTEEQNGEATLDVSKKFHEPVYLNPVYLTSEGSYYTIMGNSQGSSFSGDIGTIYSQTIDSAITIKNDDSSKTESSSYKINVAIVEAAKTMVMKEMNQNDELVKATEYFATSPEEFTVDSETSYVIVEEVVDNSLTVKYARTCYIPLPKDTTETSNQHHCNFPAENGIIAPKLVKFICE